MKTISDHVLDIVRNSVRAKATLIEIIVGEDKKNDFYTLYIKDNGCGIKREDLEKAADPFFTSRKTRKVGLGLALLKQNAENANGTFEILSEPGEGTVVKAVFQWSHLDRPPLGDIWDTLYLTMLHSPVRLIYRHKTGKGTFKLDSAEVKEMLGGVPLQQKEMREAIIEWIQNNLKEIRVIR